MGDTPPVRARPGAIIGGLGWYGVAAAALFILAVLIFLLELQAPEAVVWTGHRVVGTEQSGLVYYRWQGEDYTITVPGYGSGKAVGVYLDPGDPGNALADVGPHVMVARGLVALPLAGGVSLLFAGLVSQWRGACRRSRDAATTRENGLPTEFVARRLEELRANREHTLQRPDEAPGEGPKEGGPA
jgi:hypothetical protein